MLPESPDNPHAMIPFGAGEAKVTVPIPKKAVWFVAQIVYEDPTAEVLSLGTSGNSKPVGPPGAPMKEKKPSKTTTKTSEGTK
jgi:hypothetical protein